ncbi:Uncharacterised protein [Mycobacteroides abscessus subsp. massiliense]|nr:Uncharacterised protein [Mycobacteroides abscessus subsp. massiliense]
MRVDVVEVLAVDRLVEFEGDDGAVDGPEVVGDVAVGAQHIAAVNHRHDGHGPQHRPQDGRDRRRRCFRCQRVLEACD